MCVLSCFSQVVLFLYFIYIGSSKHIFRASLVALASYSRESACNAGDLGLIPGSGRSPGEGNGYPLQYSCLKNPMDRGAWQSMVYRVKKSWTRLKQLSTRTHVVHIRHLAHG